MDTDAIAAHNEKEIWSGTPSQMTHLGLYALCALATLLLLIASVMLRGSSWPWWLPLVLVVVPVFVAARSYLRTSNDRITLTDQRLILRRGILSRTTDYVELYRIKDSHFTQPFTERLLGLGTIRLRTTQDSAPLVELHGMRSP
ncbi:MAG TPA: PH domain-containing protein, partial [Xanthomonadaceae bacterium]|nr:PH domain-containing protein [Xanthomonadaceae bacterium]